MTETLLDAQSFCWFCQVAAWWNTLQCAELDMCLPWWPLTAVVVGGKELDSVPETLEVPQGPVLGPILFLVHINDLPDNVSSQVCLFTDVTAMCSHHGGCGWQLRTPARFGPTVCVEVWLGHGVQPSKCRWQVLGNLLIPRMYFMVRPWRLFTCARYLGADVSSSLSWGFHIDRITGTANKTLRFVKRNIETQMSDVREAAYNTLVQPQLEYDWNMLLPYGILIIKTRLARFRKSNDQLLVGRHATLTGGIVFRQCLKV